MSTKKVIGGSVAAIVILIIAQLAAQLAASALNLIKIPDGICNIIAGIFYVGLTYVILKIYIEKVIRLPISDFGMPVFHIKRKWILIAILLPLLVKGSYLLFFQGAYVSSHMNGKQIFRTLSAGIMFTGIAAGFVEEMVFRGVILNLLRKKWNRKVAVIVPSVLFGMVHIGNGFFHRKLFAGSCCRHDGGNYVFNDCNREWFCLEQWNRACHLEYCNDRWGTGNWTKSGSILCHDLCS